MAGQRRRRPDAAGFTNLRCMTDRTVRSWLTDMDGVLVREEHAIPGAADFIGELERLERPYLVLTNNSIYSRRDLQARLRSSGIEVRIWTSALATAQFLAEQSTSEGGRGTVFVIGEFGLTAALHEAGFVLSESDPDFVVLGETRTYSFSAITKAIRLVTNGARFIATNPDVTGPSPDGPIPATGSVAALITAATGVKPYYVGKPNPLMMRSALNAIEAHSESTVMIGDRMETDIIAGIESGLRSALVLTGSTRREEIARHSFRPTWVLESIADVVPMVEELGREPTA